MTLSAPAITADDYVSLQHFYASYAACLDAGSYAEWPDYFTENCLYRIVPRENFEMGLPLATLSLTSRAMLVDRVYGIESTIFHAPYYQRHVIGPLLIATSEALDTFAVEANYCVFRTKRDMPSEVFNAGRYVDRVVRDGDRLRFAEKLCVFDSELVPNSLIYPI